MEPCINRMEHFVYSFWYIPFGNRWLEINTTIIKMTDKQKEQKPAQQWTRPNWGGTLTLKGVKKNKKK